MSEAGASSETSIEVPRLDVVLQHYCSLSARGFRLLMILLSVVSFAAGGAFTMLGAWPVFGFLTLALLAIYIAFRLNYRRARLFETIKLDGDFLNVGRVHPNGRIENWSLPPNWLRVQVVGREQSGAIRLRSHGRELLIGRFLTPAERNEVAATLHAALERWRLAPHLRGSCGVVQTD